MNNIINDANITDELINTETCSVIKENTFDEQTAVDANTPLTEDYISNLHIKGILSEDFIQKFIQCESEELNKSAQKRAKKLGVYKQFAKALNKGITVLLEKESTSTGDNQLPGIKILSRCQNMDTKQESLKLIITVNEPSEENDSPNIITHTIYMKRSELNKTSILRLADYGLAVGPHNAKAIYEYLVRYLEENFNKLPIEKTANRYGWYEENRKHLFVPYSKGVGASVDEGFPQVGEPIGSFDTWKQAVLPQVSQHKSLRLILAATTASLLAKPVNALPSVLNVYGTSNTGKTVGLMIAASMVSVPDVGEYIRNVDSTPAYIDALLNNLHDLPVLLDDTAQKHKTYDSLVMKLCMRTATGKMNNNNRDQVKSTWNASAIITGETPVISPSSFDGVRNRIVEVETSENDPVITISDAKELIETIRVNYGHAGKAVVEHILSIGFEEVNNRFSEMLNEINERTDFTGKMANNLALLLLADEINFELFYNIEQYNIRPWGAEDIAKYGRNKVSYAVYAAQQCVFDYINENLPHFIVKATGLDGIGEESKSERNQKISNPKGRINTTQDLLFPDSDTPCKILKDVDIKENVLREILLSTGNNLDSLKKTWAESGFISRNTQGRYVHTTTFEGIEGQFKVVRIDFSKANYQEFISN